MLVRAWRAGAFVIAFLAVRREMLLGLQDTCSLLFSLLLCVCCHARAGQSELATMSLLSRPSVAEDDPATRPTAGYLLSSGSKGVLYFCFLKCRHVGCPMMLDILCQHYGVRIA